MEGEDRREEREKIKFILTLAPLLKTNMAVPTNVYTDKFDSFNRLSNKLTSLAYSKTDGYKKTLQTILDEFNSLDFDSRSAKNHNVSKAHHYTFCVCVAI